MASLRNVSPLSSYYGVYSVKIKLTLALVILSCPMAARPKTVAKPAPSKVPAAIPSVAGPEPLLIKMARQNMEMSRVWWMRVFCLA